MSRYIFGEPRPFAHQREGLRRLIEKKGCYALLWDPGVGKTRPVIDYAGCLATSMDRPARVLVVCPKAVQDSWITQLVQYLGPGVGARATVLSGSIVEKCLDLVRLRAGEPVKGVVIRRPRGGPEVCLAVINLEALSSRRQVSRSRTHANVLKDAIRDFAPDLLVVDESHRIKSPTSNVSRLLVSVAPYTPRRVLLTGTPMPHSPMDVWSQWRVLDPTAFSSQGKPWPFGKFRDVYATMGGFYGKEIVGFKNLEDLQDRMAERSMALRKEDALDLPPVTEVLVPVHLGPTELSAYRAMKRDLVTQLSGPAGAVMTAPNRLTQMLRLRQITCGFVKDDATGAVTRIGTSREDTAMSLLEDLLATERRVVVFAWSRTEVDSLVERLRRVKPYACLAHGITGDTKDAERLRLRQHFGQLSGDDKMVLVAQLRTVSLGINELVTASHALFLSLSQQRDDLVQAMGRLDRQGQTRAVTFHFLVAPNTVDEVVLASHKDRTNLEAAMMRHISEVST